MLRLSVRLAVCLAVLLGMLAGAGSALAAGGVVISEFRTRGPLGGSDEFVEIYNSSNAPVDVTGWTIRGSNNAGTNSVRATVTSSRLLDAGCYLLFTNATATTGYSGSVPGDFTYLTGITDDGGVALANVGGGLVDQVGMSTGSAYKEGTTLAAFGSTNSDRSYERKPGGAFGNGQDTDDNASDFAAIAPSAPQNALSTCIPNVPQPTSPSGTGAASPSSVAAGGTTLLSVAVTPGTNPTSTGLTVTGDLSSIGGSATQSFFDDATHGDATAGDGTFSFSAAVAAATSAGGKTLPVTIADAEARTGSASIALTVTAPVSLGTPVVVSEFRTRGPSGGNDEFVELYNATNADIAIGGWKIKGSNSAGTTGVRATIPADLMLGAGCHYLLTNAATGGYSGSVTGDQTYLTGITDDGGIALTKVDDTIVDQVGMSATSAFKEGTTLAPLTTTGVDRGYERKPGGASGSGQDTNDNAVDFALLAPTDPQNTLSTCVGSTTPTNPSATGAANPSATTAGSSTLLTVTVTPGTNPASTGISASGDLSSIGGSPAQSFFDNGTNGDAIAGDNVFSFNATVASGTDLGVKSLPVTVSDAQARTAATAIALTVVADTITKIHEIQGSGLTTPKSGELVTIEGVVVGDYQLTPSEFNGFYVQEEDADADANPATSEGIFVFGGGVPVNVGDVVRVRGTAGEFSGMTQLSSVSSVAVEATGSSVTPAAVGLPVANVNDLEAYEGMRVNFAQTLTVTEVFNLGRFGEVSLSGAGRLYTPTAVAEPGAPAQAVAAQNNRSRIILDDGNNQQNIDPTRYPQGGLSATNTLRVGDTLAGLAGIMDFRFSNYRIQPVSLPLDFVHTNPRTAAPDPVGGNLKVASFNVLNYFNGDGTGGGFPTERGATTLTEFNRQRAKEISALTAMNAEVVGLMEIENDAEPNSAVGDLVSGLNGATAPGTYAFVNTGVIGTDAIKVALIYKPSAVTPVGDWKIITTATDPRFLDNKNRPSLAQTFQHDATGEKFTVVVNHLKSKGSDCNDVGDPDTGDGSGNCNVTRTNAANALVDWLATDPTGSGDPDFLLIGDMNSYTFESPIKAFETGGFTNLVRAEHGLTAYSYVFNGESGYLDHALATSSLTAQVTHVADWHINPDEPTVLDYNVEFKTANQVNTFYSPDAYRSSDHDPVVIGLNLVAPTPPNRAPSVDAGGPYTVEEGSSVTVCADGSDPDGDTLTYGWDLDGDGTFETAGQCIAFAAPDDSAPQQRTIAARATDPDGLSAADPATVQITWRFSFVAPTEGPPAVNAAKAGEVAKVLFSLVGDQGPAVLAEGSPSSSAHDCGTAGAASGGEPATPDKKGLSYDAKKGVYTYAWTTAKAWKGTCRTFVLELADGTTHVAEFRFK